MSISQKVISAVGWSAAVKIGFQLVTWAMTLLVIRILSPDDYGLMAITQIFISVLGGLANVGLADALIQREETPRPIVAAVFGLLLVVTLVTMTALFFAAYPLAGWYEDARLVPLIQISSLGLLFSTLCTMPRVYLTKSLRVRPIFVLEMSSGVMSSFIVIALAYLGYGVWSLMIGWLSSMFVRCIGFLWLTPEYFVWPSLDFGPVKPLLSYGYYRTLDYLTWVAYTSADALIIGRMLGTADLGRYAVAMNFAGMPLSKIAPIINSVAFPAFAMVQTNPSEARFYATKAMRMAATLAVPVFFGVSAIAPEIVDLVFGPKWAATEPMLAVLSLAVAFRAILLVVPNYLQGIGHARAGFWCTMAGLIIFVPAVYVGCHFGIMGACYAWLLGYPVMYAVNVWIAARWGGLDARKLLLIPLGPMLAGGVMIAAITLLRPYVMFESFEIARVVTLILAGAAVYTSVLGLAFRPLLTEILSLVRKPQAAA